MILNFKDKRLQAFLENTCSQTAKYFPPDLWKRIIVKLNAMKYAECLDDLRASRANHLEALRGNYAGFYSIRVNDKYRIIFRPENDQALAIEFVDYH